MATGTSRVTVDFSVKAEHMIKDLIKAVRGIQVISNISRPGEELYYDDETLDKVREAIEKSYRELVDHPEVLTNDIISSLQNAGILFRERKQ